jgi:hypothetical protein
MTAGGNADELSGDFCEAYPKLAPRLQSRFRNTVSRLLAGRILTPGGAFDPDEDWSFLIRHSSLVESYLAIAGWRIQLDRSLGVARVVSDMGDQRASLNKLDSWILCVARLAWHEQRTSLSEDTRCTLAIDNLRERLVRFGAPVAAVSRNRLREAIRRLARFDLIAPPPGFTAHDTDELIVSPVVEKIITVDRVSEWLAQNGFTADSDPSEISASSESSDPLESIGQDDD